MVIALKSFAGFAGHAAHVSVDVELTLIVTAAAVAGSFAGAALSRHFPAELLRRAFAGFVLLMAGYVVWREVGLVPAGGVVGAAAAILAWWRWTARGAVKSHMQSASKGLAAEPAWDR
jgi:hypothetical protein